MTCWNSPKKRGDGSIQERKVIIVGKQEVTTINERKGSDTLECTQKIDLLRKKSSHSELKQ